MPSRIKLNVRATLDEKDFELLLAYAEEMKLSQSRAIALLLTKTLQVMYKDKERIANLDDLTTVDQVVKEAQKETIDLESLEFLLRHSIASMKDVKDQHQNILHKLDSNIDSMENYRQEMTSFRFDFLQFSNEFQNFRNDFFNFKNELSQMVNNFQMTIQQEIQNLWSQLYQLVQPIQDSLQRLAKIFRV
ncbi:hypothetical protein [Cyanothece sp. BG0011]|uniref:hypothetical protein n=1 Tax=Cyanothece sp. BG0011 TaxID=2082950 RepID=UPI000D1D7F2A|nr:hypothetical protein [Cyanothece sp. BG0011]